MLRQHHHQLKFVAAAGACLQPEPMADLNAVLISLYLEETEINPVVQELERLVTWHQTLRNQQGQHQQELEKIQSQIFWLLGLKKQSAKQQPLTQNSPKGHPTKAGKILVVDDHPTNVLLLSTLLNEHGYKVETATTSIRTLTLAREISPDLILLDIMMPAMDGYEICQILKADSETKKIPVIFVSALTKPSDTTRAFNVGAAGYITKPLKFEDVLAKVKQHILSS